MGPGPITEIIATVSDIFSSLAGRGWVYNSSSLTAMSFMFTLLGVVAVGIMFYVQIIRHNKVCTTDERINTLKEAVFFFGARFLVIPLIVGAPALPLLAKTIADNFSVWGSSQAVAMQVAGVGDTLISKLMVLDRSSIHPGNDPTTMDPAMLQRAGIDVVKARQIGNAKMEAAAKTERLVKELEAANNPAAQRAAQGRLDAARKAQNQIEGQVDQLLNQYVTWANKNQARVYNAEMYKRAMDKLLHGYDMANGVTYNGARGAIKTKDGGSVSDWSNLDPNNIQAVVDERTGAVIARGEDIAKALLQVEKENAKADELGASWDPTGVTAVAEGSWIATKALYEFITNVGFYLSIAPAVLGILAGALSTLKASFGLLQFGAKISIMVNLGLSIATIFSSFFVFMFLFRKTEQFAFTYFRFLFSVVLACFGIHFVMSTVGMTVAQASYGLVAQCNSLLVKAGMLGKSGSMELFKTCCGAGLAAFAVGMLVDFIVELCKSAGQVAQGSLTGSFNP